MDVYHRYRLFKRKVGKKSVFYARFLDSDGNLLKTLATGKTNEYQAHDWCRAKIDEQSEKAKREAEQRNHITVAELADGFWDREGTYAQSRIARGYDISNGHLSISEGYTRNHILPKWGDRRVADLTVGSINSWVLELHKERVLAPATINKILATFRSLLNGAVLRDYLSENPAASVKPLRSISRERGVLTDAEIDRLFSSEDVWQDHIHYTANLIAMYTGARIGEIRGLRIRHVMPGHIKIEQSWEEGHGIKDPKYGSKRAVPIPVVAQQAIERVILETEPDDLIFYSSTRKDRPMSKSHIEKQFYAALERIGISPEERQQRNITFHSYRHKLATTLRSRGVPDSKIRLLTGHRSEGMIDWYTKYTSEDFADVLEIQAGFLPSHQER